MNARTRMTLEAVPVDVDWSMLALLVLRHNAWNQRQLARELGCAQSTVAHILDGRTPNRWKALARLLNIAARTIPERDYAECVGRPEAIEIELPPPPRDELPTDVDVQGLLKALKSRRITLRQVGRTLGIPPNTLSMMAQDGNGKRTIDTIKLDRGLRLLHYARRVLPESMYREHVR